MSIRPFMPSLVLQELFNETHDTDFSSDFRAIIVSIQNTALVLIFQGRKIEGSDQENNPRLLGNLSIESMSILLSRKFIPHFYTSTRATFTGSHHFAALHVQFKPQGTQDTPAIEQAFRTHGTTFYRGDYALTRLPDSWVNFNDLEGLKFTITQPFYVEVRAHQQDQSLFDLQKKEIEEASTELLRMKQKELQLIGKRSDLEGKKADRVKSQTNTQDLDRQLLALNGQLEGARKSMQEKTSAFSKLMLQPPANAASGPVLRALTRLSVCQLQDACGHMALAFGTLFKLNEVYFHAKQTLLHEDFSSSLKQRKVKFFESWVKYLKTHYVHIVHTLGEESKADVAQERLKGVTEDLTCLTESLALKTHFLAGGTSFPTASRFLSGANGNFLTSLREEIQKREEKLSQFIFSSMMDLVSFNPQNYLADSLLNFSEAAQIFDLALEELGLIDVSVQGEQRYLSSLEYAKKRAVIDDQISDLSCVAFIELLQKNISSPLLPAIKDRVRAKLPLVTMMKALNSPAPTLLAPYAKKRKTIMDTYNAFMGLLGGSDYSAMQSKWGECKRAIDDLLADLPRTKTPYTAKYLPTLSNFQKTLPDSFPHAKIVSDLKKELKEPDDLMKIGEAASFLKQLPENTTESSALFKHLEERALLHFRATLRDFPKLKVRHWLAQPHESRLQIQKHIYWPRQGNDPYYKANETHIPI
jgi:hypothetical protein